MSHSTLGSRVIKKKRKCAFMCVGVRLQASHKQDEAAGFRLHTDKIRLQASGFTQAKSDFRLQA